MSMRIRLVDAVTGLTTWLKGSGGAALVNAVAVGPELADDAAGTTLEGGLVVVNAGSSQSAAINYPIIEVCWIPLAATPASDTSVLVTKMHCFISIGSNPTAQAGDMVLYAGRPRQFPITPGNKIAAYNSVANAGILFWHPVE